MIKLVTLMLVLLMSVSVVYSADAVIEDEDENTNPQHVSEAAKVAAQDADDYVPSEEEVAEAEGEEDDDYHAEKARDLKERQKDITDKNMTLNWDKKVIELEADNFDYWIDKFDALMVEIYAPWCGHCKDFVDKYNEVGQQLFDNAPRYFVAKINGHQYPEIGKRFEVKGYPYFIFFKRGKPVVYDGGRNVKSIVEYVKKNGPENVQLLNCGQLIEQKRRTSQMVVYFGSTEAHSRFLMTESMSIREKRFSFFWNNEPECWEKHGVKPNTITFMTNFELEGHKMVIFEGKAIMADFAAFLVEPAIPPLVQYDLSIGETMRSVQIPTIILFRNEEDEFEDYAGVYKKAALANRGRAIFVWSDKDDEDGAELSKHMKVSDYGLDPGGPIYPSIRAMWIYKNRRYISQIDPYHHTVESITKFVDECLAETHEEFLPSIFHDPYFDLRLVPELSGRRFTKQMMTQFADKDVVIYFFSPECPHCAKYTPQYYKLARALSNHPDLQFVMMDAVNNMVQGLNIARYPSVQFWPAAHRNNTKQGDLQRQILAEDSRVLDVQLDWLIANSDVLRAANVTKVQIMSEEETAITDKIYHQREVDFNATIQKEKDDAAQAEVDKKKAMEEKVKAQKEAAEKQKEYEELKAKAEKEMKEMKKKAYEKNKVELDDKGEVKPSGRIPGEKKKADPNAVPLDKDGNPMVKREFSEIGM